MSVIQHDNFPKLSLSERDRRFEKTRQFMDEHNLDFLVLTEGGNRTWRHWTINQFYLSNEPDGQSPIVIFPRHSEPVLFLLRTHWGIVQSEIEEGVTHWIDDIRLNEPDPITNVTEFLKARGLDKGRAGIVSGTSNSPWPWIVTSLDDPLWRRINEVLPGVEAQDMATPFTMMAMVRSPEEVEMARVAAQATEKAAEAILSIAKPGVSELELYAAGAEALAAGGIDEHVQMMTTGEKIMGLQQPRWFFPNRAPRIMGDRDIAMFEFFPVYAGVDVQTQLCMHFGEPTQQIQHMAKVGRDAYQAFNRALKPGITFKEAWEPMVNIILDNDCWGWGPCIHALPLQFMGPIQAGLEGRSDVPDAFKDLAIWDWGDRSPIDNIVMQEGMLIANEPGISQGHYRVYLGNTVACANGGTDELSTLCGQVHFID